MVAFLAFTFAVLLAPQSPVPATGTLSGRIIEEGTGVPISGAQIVLTVLGQSPLAGPPTMIDTTTDAAGRFAFSALAPGRYILNLTKNGYAVQQGPGVSPPPVEIVAGRATTIERTLQRSAIIVGRVTDEAGEPIAEAHVMALRRLATDPAILARYANRPDMIQNINRLLPIGQTAQTNDLGEFRIFGLPPGEYFVQASPRPQPSFGTGSGTPRGRVYAPTFHPGVVDSDAAQSLMLSAGQTSDALVIALQIVPAFQVSGIVVDESGAPVPGAMVMIAPDRSSTVVFGPVGGGTRTDASGQFTVANVRGGRYQITAAIPNVITGPAGSGGAGVGAVGGGFTTFTLSGTSSVSVGGGGTAVATESRGGTTTQFRMDAANRLTIDVSADLTGLQVVARRLN